MQLWIKENILDEVEPHICSHAFLKDRSIKTNAKPHVGKDFVIKMDIKDFFPSIKLAHVYYVFLGLGFNPTAAKILSLLTTAPIKVGPIKDRYDMKYFIHTENRFLPQGGPSSPAISNLVFFPIDQKILEFCKSHGLNYTRYADDLTFSFNFSSLKLPFKNHRNKKLEKMYQKPKNIKILMNTIVQKIKKFLHPFGFTLNKKKINGKSQSQRQKITGVVVNEKINIPRSYENKVRGLLHKLTKYGAQFDPKTFADLYLKLKGMIAFVHSIDTSKGEKYFSQFSRIPTGRRCEELEFEQRLEKSISQSITIYHTKLKQLLHERKALNEKREILNQKMENLDKQIVEGDAWFNDPENLRTYEEKQRMRDLMVEKTQRFARLEDFHARISFKIDQIKERMARINQKIEGITKLQGNPTPKEG